MSSAADMGVGGFPLVPPPPPSAPDAQKAEYSGRRYNAYGWANLDPAMLGVHLRNFSQGYYTFSAAVFEKILNNDATVQTVAAKRFRAIAGMDWEIATLDDSPEAAAQAEYLQDFFDTLDASSVDARDMRQGIETLIYQLMSAVALRYSAAEIMWKPATLPDGRSTLHAETLWCPLRYFSALGRELRIRIEWTDTLGSALEPDKWIVCAAPGEPIIMPTAILSMLKMTPLEDWSSAVECFGIPWVVGYTSRQPGEPEYAQLVNFVSHAKNRFGGVLGNEAKVEVMNGLSQPPPHRELVEYIDRAIASLWRGGDLSTMSRGGDANGASLQIQETGNIQKIDRQLIESTIDRQLTRRFIRMVFGEETRPLAYFHFVQDDSAERSRRASDIRAAWEMGLALPENFVRSTFGIPAVSPDDAVVRKPEQAAAPFPSAYSFGAENADAKLFNAAVAPDSSAARDRADAERELAEAQRRDLAEISEAVDALAAAKTDEEFNALLADLKAAFPALEARAKRADALGEKLTEILMRDVRKDVAAAAQKGGDKR